MILFLNGDLGCLCTWNFPMQLGVFVWICTCVCVHVIPQPIFLFFFFMRPRAVLPLDCITCSAPVWLSLAGWWSFLAGYENQSEFLAPTFPHTLTGPTTRLILYSLLLFFPDCNASVHKGCRDSLPVCAKVKMKVNLHSQLVYHWFCSMVLSCGQYWFFFCFFLSPCV